MYVEQKTSDGDSLNDRGRATITDVKFSKSGRSIYYEGRRLAQAQGVFGNYYDVNTGDEFWVTGIKAGKQSRNKKGGTSHPNRHPSGGGKVIDKTLK